MYFRHNERHLKRLGFEAVFKNVKKKNVQPQQKLSHTSVLTWDF